MELGVSGSLLLRNSGEDAIALLRHGPRAGSAFYAGKLGPGSEPAPTTKAVDI